MSISANYVSLTSTEPESGPRLSPERVEQSRKTLVKLIQIFLRLRKALQMLRDWNMHQTLTIAWNLTQQSQKRGVRQRLLSQIPKRRMDGAQILLGNRLYDYVDDGVYGADGHSLYTAVWSV